MAQFTFRLATLLRLREAVRDQRRAELAEAYRVDDLLQNQQSQADEQLAQLRLRCRKMTEPGTIQVDPLIDAQRYEVVLKARQGQLKKQRDTVAAEIERRREVLNEATREVRVLEKLRDKQEARHRAEGRRQETKFLDEVAGARAAREETL